MHWDQKSVHGSLKRFIAILQKLFSHLYQFTTSDVVLVFLLSTLNTFYTFFIVSIVVFEQVNVSWVVEVVINYGNCH